MSKPDAAISDQPKSGHAHAWWSTFPPAASVRTPTAITMAPAGWRMVDGVFLPPDLLNLDDPDKSGGSTSGSSKAWSLVSSPATPARSQTSGACLRIVGCH